MAHWKTGTVSELQAIDADVERALEAINVPAYVIDSHGIIRWVNPAGKQIMGDVTGGSPPPCARPRRRAAREKCSPSKIAGTAKVTDAEVVLIQEDGERVGVEVSSVPLHSGGQIICVFGQLVHVDEEPDRPLHRT
jgi:PAS domain S-box-containing protein